MAGRAAQVRYPRRHTTKPRLGRYKLLRKLAQGGMAQVYLARQTGVDGFSKRVVIKRLEPASAQDPGLQDMFVSEAALAGQLNHPNVVHVIDFAEAQGERFLVMEFVDGPSLKTLLKLAAKSNRLLPVEHCLKIASWVCEGLAYAHSLKHERTGAPLSVVHRDVTPDNIVITRTGVVKVIDFGIAKAATQVHQTRPGEVKGKMAYLAPEQLFSNPIDRRADIFALGIVLYEALTGVQPFARETDAAVIDAVLRHPIPPVTSLRPDVPAALDAIIAKATAKERDLRYSNALELQAALELELARLLPAFTPGRLRELVASLDPPHPPEEDDEESTDSDSLALALPADDDDSHTDRMLAATTAATKTSPKLNVPSLDTLDEPEPKTSPDMALRPPEPPRRQVLPVLPLVALMLTTGVATWVVSTFVNRPGEEAPAPIVITVPASPPAPAPAPPPPPVVEPDAGEAQAAAADARVQVSLTTDPPATLFVDGTRAGDTPLAVPMEVGPHRLRFENPDAGLNKSVVLRVPDAGPFAKDWVFERAMLTIEAPVGATVWLGKRSLGEAPLPPLELYEGTYRFRLVQEGAPEIAKTVELKPGETTEKIGVE